MKILHISTSDRVGGAAIAAYRMNEAMNDYGIESHLLVMNKTTSGPMLFSISDGRGKFFKILYNLCYSFSFHLKKNVLHPRGLFSLGCFHSYHLTHFEEVQNADIIYVHWINNFFLGVRELERILSLGKPVVFFMHDMWLLTGGCHYAFSCNGFQFSCAKCPNIGRDSVNFIAKYILQKKKRLASYDNIYLMSPSQWMDGCVKESVLFGNRKRVVVPNTLNVSRFSFIDKSIARRVLGLPLDKQLILFAADGGTNNEYKGWHLLKDALMQINKSDIGLMILGNHLSSQESSMIPHSVYSLGKIVDECSLALLYSAANIYVTSALVESFGQTIVEAQACGTLVVGFNTGGIPDIITHKVTGYLAKPGDVVDLKYGILWALSNCEKKSVKMALQDSVRCKFSYETVVKLHVNFWSEIIN